MTLLLEFFYRPLLSVPILPELRPELRTVGHARR